jgi:hypothetical protein
MSLILTQSLRLDKYFRGNLVRFVLSMPIFAGTVCKTVLTTLFLGKSARSGDNTFYELDRTRTSQNVTPTSAGGIIVTKTKIP